MSKVVTCPSGAKACIRKLNVRDVQALGMIPDVYASDAKDIGGSEQKKLELASNLTTVALTCCLISYTLANGQKQTVFDTSKIEAENQKLVAQSIAMKSAAPLARIQDLGELPPGVLRLSEFMSDPDASFIVQEILAFSGFGEAGKEAARPFPEQPNESPSGVSTGESVSRSAG